MFSDVLKVYKINVVTLSAWVFCSPLLSSSEKFSNTAGVNSDPILLYTSIDLTKLRILTWTDTIKV